MNFKEINERLKEILNEHAWKNACGKELTIEEVNRLRQLYPSLRELKQDTKADKISWMIHYIDTLNKEQLIGLKISNIGKIEYIENNETHTEYIDLCVGDTDTFNNVIESNQGLYHMKYGNNKHWKQSKEALHIIPNDFIGGNIIKSEEPSKYKYFYRYKKNNYLYVIGIPSEKGDATVLITCLKLDK